MESVHEKICYACGEIRFTLQERFDNELIATCENCGCRIKFYSSKDFSIEEMD